MAMHLCLNLSSFFFWSTVDDFFVYGEVVMLIRTKQLPTDLLSDVRRPDLSIYFDS